MIAPLTSPVRWFVSSVKSGMTFSTAREESRSDRMVAIIDTVFSFKTCAERTILQHFLISTDADDAEFFDDEAFYLHGGEQDIRIGDG